MSGTVIRPLTTVFTPPPSCSASWTYEGPFYNHVSRGILIQNDLPVSNDKACFPPGFMNYGRLNAPQMYLPGICPEGYTTPASFRQGGTTTGICCPQDFFYSSTLTTINGNPESGTVQFAGCISTFPSGQVTQVSARSGNYDLQWDTVTGPMSMWAQPITVAYRQSDQSLFPAPTSTPTTATPTTSPSVPATTTSPAVTATTTITTTSPSPHPSNGSGSTALSTGAKAGIGVGVGVGVLAIIAACIYFFMKRRPAQKETNSLSPPTTYEEVYKPEQVKLPAEMEVPPAEMDTPHPKRQNSPAELGS